MLQGKGVLVTGSSQGIGLAAARAMLAAGARVVLTSERPLAACPDVRAVLA
jgi:NAD(P)-dependent dehydrogenase (short-subunit alcohol dehydrogenase family)